mmetsp:Transcript_31067/g.40165  ORF Transcript_31067/g.40165 Transcript_31067/m.40165 type:complete len:211 (-) Transcript_31067:46-678(-)
MVTQSSFPLCLISSIVHVESSTSAFPPSSPLTSVCPATITFNVVRAKLIFTYFAFVPAATGNLNSTSSSFCDHLYPSPSPLSKPLLFAPLVIAPAFWFISPVKDLGPPEPPPPPPPPCLRASSHHAALGLASSTVKSTRSQMSPISSSWHLPTNASPQIPPGGAAPIATLEGDGSPAMLCPQATKSSVARLLYGRFWVRALSSEYMLTQR